MAKQQIHLNLNEFKNLIKEQIMNLFEYNTGYPARGECTFTPGYNANISEEEYETLQQYMKPEYTIEFYEEDSGGDGWETPREYYIVPFEDDVEKIYADINKIPDEHLKQAITNEFEEWFSKCDPEMEDYEPDPDRYRDDPDGIFEETNIKSYLKTIIREEIEGMNNRQYVIQTKTGGYLMEIYGEPTTTPIDTVIIPAKVGNTYTFITVNSFDYDKFINNGKSCDGTYFIVEKDGTKTPEMPCSISIYNA